MPNELAVALFVACGCVVAMTICVIIVSMNLSRRLTNLENEVLSLAKDTRGVMLEGQAVLKRTGEILERVESQMKDVEQITHTARDWVARADQLVDGVGSVVEPPLSFLSKNVRVAQGFLGGVLQTFLSRPQKTSNS